MRRLLADFSRIERLVLSLCLLILAARFVGLGSSPPGWFTDETNVLNTICLRHTGYDMFGSGWLALHRWSIIGTSPYLAPAYTLPSVAWLQIFGESVWSIRALEVAFSLITVIAVAGIARNFLGKSGFLWALGLCAIDPWSWSLSRVAFGHSSTHALMFLMIGVWILTRGGWQRQLTMNEYLAGGLFLGVATTAQYTVLSAVVIASTVAVLLRIAQMLDRRFIRVPAVMGLLTAVYLKSFPAGTGPYSNGSRAGQVSILDKSYRDANGLSSNMDLLRQFAKNMGRHLSPNFLFTHGDSNTRHHSGLGGELSWVLIFLLIAVPVLSFFLRNLKSKLNVNLIVLSLGGILGGLASASLTYEAVPHANRALPAAPFFILLGTTFAVHATQKFDLLPLFCLGLGLIFVNWYGTDYFTTYPKRSVDMFASRVRAAGEEARKTGDFSPYYEAMPEFRRWFDIVPRGTIFWEALGTGNKCPGKAGS